MRPWRAFLIIVSTALLAASCGGGGGGGDPFDEDNEDNGIDRTVPSVSLMAEPSTIDSGDSLTVTLQLDGVGSEGALIKIRFPDALSYEESTSLLKPDGESAYLFDPSLQGADSDGNKYLVYFMTNATLGENNRGLLRFFLKGESALKSAEIEIDADRNDPLIADGQEFNATSPQFSALDSVSVRILGEESSDDGGTATGTPTVTPTPSPTTSTTT